MESISRIISVGRPWRLGPPAVAFALVVAVAVGCGSRYDFEGKWVGKRALAASPETDPSILRTVEKIEITIRGSNFEMIEAGIPKTGTVRYADGKAYLKVLTRFNRPIEELGQSAVKSNVEVILEPKGPNDVLYLDPAGFDDGPIALARESQPTG